MAREYTFSIDRRKEAIEMAAKVAFEGEESTIHCGLSDFGASPWDNFVREFYDGQYVGRHSYRSELHDGRWVFLGMSEMSD